MRRLFFALLAVLLLLPASSAAAATPEEALEDVITQGYYVEPGSRSISTTEIEALITSARNEGVRLMVVILDEEPAGGAVTFGDALLDVLGDGTVIVLTRSDSVGVVSTEYARSETDAALDDADVRGGDDITYLTSFVGSLVFDAESPPVTAAQEPVGSSGGGSGGLIVLLLIVAALVLAVVFVVWRSKKKSEERSAKDIANARSEIKAQLDAMANDILELETQVAVSDSEQVRDHYEQASAVYASATEHIEAAETLDDFEKLADEVAMATWQMDAAQALLDGQPVPAKPEPREYGRCFFDPTHRGPFEDATLETNAGKKTVRVCRADAEKLRRGEEPKPRMIEVGGRSVPAAHAPRSQGGGGLGGLDLFSILVGGMAAGRATSWGSSSRSSRSGGTFRRSSGGRPSGSVFGSSSRTRSSSSSRRRSSSTRSRSSSSRSRTGRRRNR